MRWHFLFIVFLLCLFSVSASVLDVRLEQFRTTSYQGYPSAFTGKVVRADGTTTSETESYAAVLECSSGSYDLCLAILSYSDRILWKTGKNTFSWFADAGDVNAKGWDSASDGDFGLLFASLRAYQRSGKTDDLDRFHRWSANIAKYDTCHYGDTIIIASGSGIGRSNGCNSFNGVYAGYILLPFLRDLAKFDPATWELPFKGALKESYDLSTMNGNIFPNRCAAYNTQSLNNALCEIHAPEYMDYLDAQRWVFWTGLYCLNPGVDLESTNLCMHLHAQVDALPKDFSTGSQGYELSGQVKGKSQYSPFAGALWLPGSMAFRNDSSLLKGKLVQWQPSKFDPFKDALILISLTLTNDPELTPPTLLLPVELPSVPAPVVLNDSQDLNPPASGSPLEAPEPPAPPNTEPNSGENIPSVVPEENISPFLTSVAVIGFCAVCLLGIAKAATR